MERKLTTYLLRNIPDEIWEAAKIRAAQDRMTLRKLILIAIVRYVGERKG